MIPNDVVKLAYDYLASVVPAGQISSVRVEELQKDSDQNWLVTLSYDALGDLPFEKKREYKEFKVVDSEGKVEYMKIKRI